MEDLYCDLYVCPKDGRKVTSNPRATINIARLMGCDGCYECKERARYYGKGKGRFDFPKGERIRISDMEKERSK